MLLDLGQKNKEKSVDDSTDKGLSKSATTHKQFRYRKLTKILVCYDFLKFKLNLKNRRVILV